MHRVLNCIKYAPHALVNTDLKSDIFAHPLAFLVPTGRTLSGKYKENVFIIDKFYMVDTGSHVYEV